MENFKEETLHVLKIHGKTISDIKWIGNGFKRYTRDISTFFDNIDFEYDEYYGNSDIELSLVIVGEDWWLERQEEDRIEWWEFRTIPKLSCKAVSVSPKLLYSSKCNNK